MDTKREHRTHVEGSPRGNPYDLSYSPSGRLIGKSRDNNSVTLSTSVDMAYGYCDDYQPHAAKRMFEFTGKELDEETGYGYFGARYMDHELMTGWLSVDPMADKYPSMSPYAYCAWNPIKLVDPDGRDVYLLTNDGHIKRSQELTDKYQNKYGGNDVLYSQETGKFSRTFTVGTLSDMESHTTKGYPGSFLKLRDTERKDCVDVFIFCAENSNVEYSLMEFAQGESKETVLTTSHQIRTYSGSYGDDMGSAYAKDNICNLLSHIHNHFFTVGASYSEDGESPDMNFMNWVNSSRICANDESQGNSVSFGIYKCRGDKYMTDYYGNTIDPITMQKIKK